MADIVDAANKNLTFEKVLMMAMKTPGVKIHREKFLHKELIKYYPEEMVRQAIDFNPAKAGILESLIG